MNAVTEQVRTELADRLWRAEQDHEPIAQPSAVHAALTVEDAYAVQQRNIRRRTDRGEQIVGRKVGLTSRAMQEQLGVDEPDFGVLTDAMVIPDGGTIVLADLVAPRLEPEYAFRIDGALPVSPSAEQVDAAIGAVALAIEVIDSRVQDWRIALVDTIADNASSARIVVGEWQHATPDLLQRIVGERIALHRDDVVVAEGPGAAVLGDPRAAVHWLAAMLGRFGEAIAPGSIVLAGAVAASVAVEQHTTWHASAAGFAPATVRAE